MTVGDSKISEYKDKSAATKQADEGNLVLEGLVIKMNAIDNLEAAHEMRSRCL